MKQFVLIHSQYFKSLYLTNFDLVIVFYVTKWEVAEFHIIAVINLQTKIHLLFPKIVTFKYSQRSYEQLLILNSTMILLIYLPSVVPSSGVICWLINTSCHLSDHILCMYSKKQE